MEAILGLIFGIAIAAVIFVVYKYYHSKRLAKSQSLILLDKIKTVCKFITVEGDFAEVYHYQDVKQKFLRLVSSRKRALIVVNAKAHVGFDLTKIKMSANAETKTISLFETPKPEILTIETNLDYYDIKDGIFNKFEASDLTVLQEEAKTHIKEKIPESGLFGLAEKEAIETIFLMENIVNTIGWKLNYSALKLEQNNDN